MWRGGFGELIWNHGQVLAAFQGAGRRGLGWLMRVVQTAAEMYTTSLFSWQNLGPLIISDHITFPLFVKSINH